MKIKKHTNGNVILIDDNGKEINRVPSDWMLWRDLKNVPMYFYVSPNNNNGGGVVIEWAKVTHLIKGTSETAWSGTDDELFAELSDNFFIKVSSSGTTNAIQTDIKGAVLGDSWGALNFTTANGNPAYSVGGYVGYIQDLIGHKIYLPTNADHGIGGQRTDQILARIDEVLAMKLGIVFYNAISNDLEQNISFNTIKNNILKTFEILKSQKIIIVTCTIPDSYKVDTFTPEQEITRGLANDLLRSLKDIILLDADIIITSSAQKADQYHLSSLGSYDVAKAGFAKLNPLFANRSTDFEYQINPDSVNNYALTGNNGGLATSWSLNTDGLTGVVTPSKSSLNGLERQVLTFSGNNTNTNQSKILFNQDPESDAFIENDIVQGVVVVEVVEKLVGFKGLQMLIGVYGEGYTPNLGGALGLQPDNESVFDFPIGVYTFKTVPRRITGGVPKQYQVQLLLHLLDNAGVQPFSGQLIIHRIGLRKIPDIYEA